VRLRDDAGGASMFGADDLDADIRAITICFPLLSAADRAALIAMAHAMKPSRPQHIHDTVQLFGGFCGRGSM
jgi:hypothetical protein